jgi:hypothetical protein
MYSRETLAQRVAAAAALYNNRSRLFAAFSVIGGLGQLWIHTVIEKRYDERTSQNLELVLFLAYIIIVMAMLVWLNRGVAASAPRCEACGAMLTKMSGRMAMATGKCDQCGAQVVE